MRDWLWMLASAAASWATCYGVAYVEKPYLVPIPLLCAGYVMAQRDHTYRRFQERRLALHREHRYDRPQDEGLQAPSI